MSSDTRRPWRNASKNIVASRTPCRPNFRAAVIRLVTSASVRNSRLRNSAFVFLRGGDRSVIGVFTTTFPKTEAGSANSGSYIILVQRACRGSTFP